MLCVDLLQNNQPETNFQEEFDLKNKNFQFALEEPEKQRHQ